MAVLVLFDEIPSSESCSGSNIVNESEDQTG